MSVHGAPPYLRSDNGPEFVARTILRWLQTAQIETAFIEPGKPWPNGADESFNGSSGTSTCRCDGFGIAWTRRSVSKRGAGTTTKSGRVRVSTT